MDRNFKGAKKFIDRIWAKTKRISLKTWVLFGVAILSLAAISLAIIFFLMVRSGHFGALPTYGDLRTIQNNIASEVYSSDGKLLGKYFIQERTHASLENISPHLLDALLATEDIRFYNHNGIDYRSLGRVFVKTILLQQESSGGGSTITQQLAKNLFPRQTHGILTMPVIKTKEAIIARRLESIYSKDEILELYLNTVTFGDNAFGIETAAERYFSSEPKNLTIPQSAMLVGMLKATTNYNPRINPESAIARRNIVLSQMEKYGYLTREKADSLRRTSLDLDYTTQSHSEGLAPYFREQLRLELARLLQNIERSNGNGNYNLYTDGLKIYTTIDSRLQKYAEEAVTEHMARLQKTFDSHWGKNSPWHRDNSIVMSAVYRTEKYRTLKANGLSEDEIMKEFEEVRPVRVFTWEGETEKEMSVLDSVKHYLNFLNAGFLVMDTHTGDVKTWVGGINHKYFKFDHVNLNTKRQVGSTFKPISYAAAIESGMEPCEFHANEQRIYAEYDNWSPRNSDGNYHGYYSMEGALTHSINTISADLIIQTGIGNTIKTAQALGIKSKLDPVPSIALGAANISLFEMVAAYSAFGNSGNTVTPRYISRIEGKNGEVIYDSKPVRNEQRAVSERTAQIMIRMMQNVVNQGTAARLRYIYGLYNDIAGKTGTTQNNADGWFIGVTPGLTAGAWVGAADPRIHFRSLDLGQGASTAMPMYALFMQKVTKDPDYKEISAMKFPSPSSDVLAALNCDSYKSRVEMEPGIIQILDDLLKRNEKIQRNPPRYPPNREQPERRRNIFDRIFRR